MGRAKWLGYLTIADNTALTQPVYECLVAKSRISSGRYGQVEKKEKNENKTIPRAGSGFNLI